MDARFAIGLLLSGASLLLPKAARAHAFLDHADPRVGSAVRSPLAGVTLTFTEGVEAAFSKIEVIDGDGKAVAVGTLEHPAEAVLRVSLPSLPAGSYRVNWKVVSVDTHETEGSFTFSIEAP
jgi:methionine-rich copper-binding protein CopC